MRTVAERIAKARGSTTRAALAHSIGVSERTVRRWESGSTKPGLDEIKKLARRLEVTVDWLVTGQNSHAPTGSD